MKVRELLRLLFWPLVAAAVVLVAITFFTYFAQGSSELLDYFLSIIDLREERTFGTWFQSLLFVAAGLSFFLVSGHPRLSLFGKWLLILMALGLCFLSADEALALHEFLGYELEQATGIVDDTALAERGYSWVLLYAPAALAVFGLLAGLYRRMLTEIPSRTAAVCFSLGWVGVLLVILMESAEGWSVFARVDGLVSILPCFEEMFEQVTLLLFYFSNLLIAEEAEL